MVARLIFLLLAVPAIAFSGEFVAGVNRNQIQTGKAITLSLTLKDASAKGNPDIEPLKKLFTIHSQHQTSNTMINNGKFSSSLIWNYTLLPKGEEDMEIPAITLDTSEGLLTTQPLLVKIVKGASTSKTIKDEVTLTTEITNDKPYKNEPVIYSIKLTSPHEMVNVSSSKLSLEDALVEMNGEPKVYTKVVDGLKTNVIEFSYLITPLKSGSLKIPSTVTQGGIPVKRKMHSGPFGEEDDFFEDDYDLLSIMRGFSQLKPFTAATAEIVLEVQAPVASVNPWLPAKSLRVEEIWDASQSIKEGEPFTRGFKIAAEGVRSNALAGIKDLQASDPSFNVYADKPELGDEVKNGIIKSFRKEQYTLIPQQSGALTLPEVSLAWWDVNKNEKVVTTIPARTLQVLPAVLKKETQSLIIPDETPFPPLSQKTSDTSSLLLAVIAGLSLLLLMAVVWLIALQKKMGRLTQKPVKAEKYSPFSDLKAPEPKKEKKEKLPDLNPT